MNPNPNPHEAINKENEDHIFFIAKLLRSRRKAEALHWLMGSEGRSRRALGDFKGAAPSVNLVKELYAAGAVKVIAADIKSESTGSQRTEKLVMELPSDTKLRASIFRWCKRQGAKVGYSPEIDGGEKHLYLLLA
ncbi:MAG TPA: hypothetical protein VGO67_18780 [Verrucomicrobiae bacterium]|jgi:hypothetical protein